MGVGCNQGRTHKASLAHSYIVDVDDANYEDIFSREELDEMEDAGALFIIPVDSGINEKLKELSKLKTAKEAYDFAVTNLIKYDPKMMALWFGSSRPSLKLRSSSLKK
ncbi:hypothetical protein BDA99DRAFT_539906 [Phascolomyces articulosus]|uniref:Uncharacterized protein n=1 Tax=Phascolomyces articulosus TaxID=60185 RepID=A0AAD5JV84_9FUNG|nr:hypothetical protein BDA99DRAFT_539906 [Phascolomyces articulosus]